MKKSMFFFFFIVISISLFSQEKTDNKILNLDLNSAVAKALDHNFNLKNSRIDNETNTITLASSWNKFLPSTSFSASYGSKRTFYKDQENITENSLSFGFETSLSLNAKIAFDINQNIINLKSGLITFDEARKRTATDIKKYYYYLKLLNEQLALETKRVGNAKLRFDAALMKYNSSVISEIDKLKSEYDYKTFLYDEKQLLTTYNTKLLEFKELLGIDNKTDINFTTEILEIKENDYEKYSLFPQENNFDIQLTLYNIKAEENARNNYIAGMTPDFGISYSLSTAFKKDPALDSWFTDTENDWNKTGTFRFSISVPLDPLFPFSNTQNNIIASQNKIRKDFNSLYDKKEKLKNNVKVTIMKLKDIESNIDSLNINKSIADSTYEMTEKLYQAGSKNYLELKDAENNLFDAKIKILSAKYDYLTNYLELEYLLNINRDKK